MNVQVLILPANISSNLISVDCRFRLANGGKYAEHFKIPLANLTTPLKTQVGTFVQGKVTEAGHTLTHIIWSDFTVTTL